MNRKILTASLIIGVIFSGCATVLGGGSKQTITIESSKEMQVNIAYVLDDNKTMFDSRSVTVPATITVERKDSNLVFRSTNDEFEPLIIERKKNPYFLGDILMLNLFSTTTDAATGALWVYDENVTLGSVDEPQVIHTKKVKVKVLDEEKEVTPVAKKENEFKPVTSF